MKKSLKDLSSLLCRTNLGTTEARKIQPETREKFERGISPRKSNWRFNDRTKSPELSLCLRLCYNYISGFTRGRPQQSKSAATTRFFPSSAKFTSGVHYHRLTLQRNISKALMTRKRGPPLLWLPTRVFWKNLRLWTRLRSWPPTKMHVASKNYHGVKTIYSLFFCLQSMKYLAYGSVMSVWDLKRILYGSS